MSAVGYKTLNIDDLQVSEPNIVSSENALSDVTPVKWDDKVTSGETKVILVADGES